MKIHKAKKSLGQNFLKSELALREIVKAGEIKKEDTVLEIGPGKGALTARLLEHAGTVIAVEKDQDLLEFLKEKFAEQIGSGTFVLVHGDILEFDPSAYTRGDSTYKIIANIPYNITGAILKKFLTENNQPELMVLMVQHEVAKRIVANDKKESILSVSVKAYGEPKMVMKVQARYFSPPPKVDSAVIKINNISRRTFIENKIDEAKFWELIHAGFAHKRKVLISNLKSLGVQADWPKVFAKLQISEKARAEDLTLVNWISIAKEI